MLSCSFSQYSLSFGAPNSLSFDMISRRLGSYSSPPYLRASFLFEAPTPEELLGPAHPQPPPQAVLVGEAADDLDKTVEFFIEEEDPEVASNAIVLVDAATQVSRPPSRPGSARASPRPFIGVRVSGVVEALITAAVPVFAARSPRASSPPPPPPPPAYADSAARVVRRPPSALLIERPRTRSFAGDGPLLEPLISDTRCFF